LHKEEGKGVGPPRECYPPENEVTVLQERKKKLKRGGRKRKVGALASSL